MVKNLLAKQGTWVQSLGQEDPVEKEMVTRSSILAWRIPWAEKPDACYSPRAAQSQTRLRDFTSLQTTIMKSPSTNTLD